MDNKQSFYKCNYPYSLPSHPPIFQSRRRFAQQLRALGWNNKRMLGNLDENTFLHVLSFFEVEELCLALSHVSKSIHSLHTNDELWKPLCRRRWEGFYRKSDWVADAIRLEENRAGATVWWTAFKQRVRQITQTVGVFAMRSTLEIGRPFGIHFFEPRYRWLVTRTLGENSSGVFCYCTSVPEEGNEAWLCKMKNVNRAPDGSADLEVHPVARCRLQRVSLPIQPN